MINGQKLASMCAEYFGVTVDYLLGKSDFRTEADERQYKIEVMRERIRSIDARGRINQLIADIQTEFSTALMI